MGFCNSSFELEKLITSPLLYLLAHSRWYEVFVRVVMF